MRCPFLICTVCLGDVGDKSFQIRFSQYLAKVLCRYIAPSSPSTNLNLYPWVFASIGCVLATCARSFPACVRHRCLCVCVSDPERKSGWESQQSNCHTFDTKQPCMYVHAWLRQVQIYELWNSIPKYAHSFTRDLLLAFVSSCVHT